MKTFMFVFVFLFAVLACSTEDIPIVMPHHPSNAAYRVQQRTSVVLQAAQKSSDPIPLPEIVLPAKATQTDGAPGDADHDGFPADQDCNDYDPETYPGAYEYCDFKDNNCDGETDETWKKIWAGVYGEACTTTGDNDCVSHGTWVCDMDHDWLVCSAPPMTPSYEKCNGLDDDCDGVTDNGAGWFEIGTNCEFVAGPACTYYGEWVCDDYDELPHCSGEYDQASNVCENP